ncbi:MAG: GlsB/YeaQ/YmgE family stress response membrane protein [Spirochaetales bacterium]|nr:GlsB/YeaQ/YmgE family stress response membrane protein [Leptospiraceae bacterium]MCP5481648.1 GlsB/YeaQ/YmgE family stress response membrane protein [Spirochaetales bacterium]
MIHLLVSIVVGGIAGFVAGQLWKGSGFGIPINVILGIVGAAIMGWLFNFFGVSRFIPNAFYIEYFIAGVLGALLLLYIGRLIKK